MAQQLCAGLDEVLAPVISTLDSFPAYLDPTTAPPDLLAWLARWLGLTIDDNQPEQRQRDLISSGVDLLAQRGTLAGLRQAIRLYLDIEVHLQDPGGHRWSENPGARLPGSADGELVVRVRSADYPDLDVRRLEAVIDFSVPAHVRYRVEVVTDP